MLPSFKPRHHQPVQRHTGTVWEPCGDPDALDRDDEVDRLVSEGATVLLAVPGPVRMEKKLKRELQMFGAMVVLTVAFFKICPVLFWVPYILMGARDTLEERRYERKCRERAKRPQQAHNPN